MYRKTTIKNIVQQQQKAHLLLDTYTNKCNHQQTNAKLLLSNQYICRRGPKNILYFSKMVQGPNFMKIDVICLRHRPEM